MKMEIYNGQLLVDWYVAEVLPVIEEEWCNSDYVGEDDD